ncbi:hypothetical protein F5X68DRAFT_213365 [Plectosphaerella plurivora]|uniref:Uncharacterized protein n=1 Tax=Plectosphaerella plurivora TaxID=936078 RepID=A0A9P8V5Z4_9PEZI|nr:hypothetical protein F5X68DRAFT_213365 [Plectosphaerella plurivora]
MWRVTQGSGDDQKEEGSVSTMVRLLRKIDQSLREDMTYGKVYGDGYACSLEDICLRHELLVTPEKPQGAEKNPPLSKGGVAPQAEPTVTGFGGVPSFPPGGLYVNASEQANDLIGDIFVLSKSILGLFVPLKGDGAGVHTDMKVVMDRYWGALDQVFRHFRFSALVSAAEGEQSWTIRGSCRDHGTSPVKCDACASKTEYNLVGALKHLHAGHDHTKSPAHDIPARPFEDPCIVWLRNTKIVERDRLFNILLDDLRTFQIDLDRILGLSKELHLFVARPKAEPAGEQESTAGSDSVNGKAGGTQDTAETKLKGEKGDQNSTEAKIPSQGSEKPPPGPGQSTDETTVQRKETPALPTSLLQAFESILALLAVQARIVVLTMRENQKKRRASSRAFKGRRRYLSILKDTVTNLENAREDLIVGITAENTSVVRLGAVGAEYIMAMTMANVQTGAFRIGAGSSKVPLSFAGIGGEVLRGTRRRAVTWTEDVEATKTIPAKGDANKPPPTTSLDVLALYAAHARALDLNSTLRPQRRAFLAIRALEEELGALMDLVRTQGHCLENSRRVFDPMSFHVTNRERQARFVLEEKVLERADDERRRESDELTAMMHRASDLRSRVKESIEVLDEGHGKAIRVFTLVTLFFLPL